MSDSIATPCFETKELETLFNRYVETLPQKKANVVGHLLSLIFSLERQFDNDPSQNLQDVKTFLQRIDWKRIRRVQSTLENHPLTRRATTTDLLLAAIKAGLSQLEESDELF
ncbi:hypothetical protein [Synechococcus sp. PCC 7335]|uniref:hypothetical protein n=1 Tax=Synechococcus sp. (strain ATCC 29403 / PCC 7335) TaxID=91464 RepID=UPI0012FC4AFD|nr:hypothetical protein [Synechococcus sp. PCC 7335]